MSADLLRRAAVKLREAATKGDMNGYMAAPWRPVLTDSESLTGVAGCGGQAADEHMENSACDDCVSIEAWTEPAAAYIALMHPPVALALADWLDAVAPTAGIDAYPPYGIAGTPLGAAIAVARTVLREPEEKP